MRLIILFFTFFTILIGYLVLMNIRRKKKTPKQEEIQKEVKKSTEDGECCGQHAVCEKESLLNTKIEIEYYDDEELDKFKNRDSDSYSDEELKLFQNVFYTLKEFDVAGWLKSLQAREISVPDSIKEEALFIIQERRFGKK